MNGLAERAVQLVKRGLAKLKVGSMETRLARCLMTYRVTVLATTQLDMDNVDRYSVICDHNVEGELINNQQYHASRIVFLMLKIQKARDYCRYDQKARDYCRYDLHIRKRIIRLHSLVYSENISTILLLHIQ